MDFGGGYVFPYFVYLVLGRGDCCFFGVRCFFVVLVLSLGFFRFYFHNMLFKALEIEAPAYGVRHL